MEKYKFKYEIEKNITLILKSFYFLYHIPVVLEY